MLFCIEIKMLLYNVWQIMKGLSGACQKQKAKWTWKIDLAFPSEIPIVLYKSTCISLTIIIVFKSFSHYICKFSFLFWIEFSRYFCSMYGFLILCIPYASYPDTECVAIRTSLVSTQWDMMSGIQNAPCIRRMHLLHVALYMQQGSMCILSWIFHKCEKIKKTKLFATCYNTFNNFTY